MLAYDEYIEPESGIASCHFKDSRSQEWHQCSTKAPWRKDWNKVGKKTQAARKKKLDNHLVNLWSSCAEMVGVPLKEVMIVADDMAKSEHYGGFVMTDRKQKEMLQLVLERNMSLKTYHELCQLQHKWGGPKRMNKNQLK